MTRPVIHDPWTALKRHTSARIALGRAGNSLPTSVVLELEAAQARARDALQQTLDIATLAADSKQLGLETLAIESQAPERKIYIQRPDLGRKLSEESRRALAEIAQPDGMDLVFILADGLSAQAVQTNAVPLLAAALPPLRREGWSIGPVVIVKGGRVAISDEIGQVLSSKLAVIALGERPGLTVPHSMGIYFTYAPRLGLTDDRRNCISNVQPQGLEPAQAAETLVRLMRGARHNKISGVALKDEETGIGSVQHEKAITVNGSWDDNDIS